MYAKWRFIFAIALAVCASVHAEELAWKLEPESVEPGQRSRLTVSLPLSAIGLTDVDEQTQLPELRDDLLLEVPNLLILDRDFRRERDTLVWTFDLTGHKAGTYRVPPVEIRFGPQTFSSEASRFVVTSNRPPGDDELRPDEGTVAPPLPWLGLAMVVLAACLGFVLFRLAKRHRRFLLAIIRTWRRRAEVLLAYESPEHWLRREIRRIVALPATETGDAAAVDAAASALRTYLERKKKVPARAWTTRELEARKETARLLSRLREAVENGDRFRFGPEKSEGAAARRSYLEGIRRTLLRKRWLP